MLFMALLILLAQWFIAQAYRFHGQPPRHYRHTAQEDKAGIVRHNRAKPEWVKHEVLRLKALMPHDSCRKIEDCFNRRFEFTPKMTEASL